MIVQDQAPEEPTLVRVIENYIMDDPFIARVDTIYTFHNITSENLQYIKFNPPGDKRYLANLRFIDEDGRLLNIVPSQELKRAKEQEQIILVKLCCPISPDDYHSIRVEYTHVFGPREEGGISKLFFEPKWKVTARLGPHHTHYVHIRPPERLRINLLNREEIERQGGNLILSPPEANALFVRFEKAKEELEVPIEFRIELPRLLKLWYKMTVFLSLFIFIYAMIASIINELFVIPLPTLDPKLILAILGILTATRAWMIYEEEMLRGFSKWCVYLILLGVACYFLPTFISSIRSWWAPDP